MKNKTNLKSNSLAIIVICLALIEVIYFANLWGWINPEPKYTTIEATVSGINTSEYVVGEAIYDTLTIDSTILNDMSELNYKYYRMVFHPKSKGHTKIYFHAYADSLGRVDLRKLK